MRYYKKLFFVCLLLLSMLSVPGVGKEGYLFRNVSPEGGFYYDGVRQIQQDRYGFIWILMDNGLYRFDGYEYKHYYSDFLKIDSSAGWQFNTIGLDGEGRLLIATNKGLYGYVKMSDSFENLLDTFVRFLALDNRNRIWVGLNDEFALLDEEHRTTVRALYEGKGIEGVTAYTKDENSFFIAANGRLYRYDADTDKFSLFYSFSAGSYVQSLCKYQNKLWVLVENEGLFKLDIPRVQIDETFDFFHAENGGNVLTKMLCMDKHGELWIATQRGLYILNPNTRQYTRYLHSALNPFSLPNNSVCSISEDRQRNIWIGTYSGYICHTNLSESEWVRTYTPREESLSHNLVSGFAEDEDRLWIATEGAGLNCLDKRTGAFTYYGRDVNANSLSSDNVKSLVMDSHHNLWIATFRGGLSCFNPATSRFRHYHHDPTDVNTLRSNNLRKIVAEADSGLWIAYQLDRLVVSFYSFANERFTHCHFTDKSDDDTFIFDICRGSGHRLWIISHSRLYALNTKDYTVVPVSLDGIAHLNAQSICVDGSDNLWIGTIGHGLIRYNPHSGRVERFDENLKLGAFSIFSICTDDENNLWMGTDNGLFRFNTTELHFARFDQKDGMQGNVYYPLSSFRSKTGELCFGGTNGFSLVNPKETNRNETKPHVIISGFYLDNALATPPARNEATDQNSGLPEEIVLNYDQANFGFTFSSDSYYIPRKNRYRYRLVGYDDKWIEVDAEARKVSYSKVPAGNYVFEVLASNNDGVWSESPARVYIHRLPAPWLSVWAYLGYAVLLAIVAFFILRYYNERKNLRLQLYLENVDKEKKEEIHQSQLRFFTNISHDFRTPLSLIIGAVDRLREEGMPEYYYGILSSNAKRLLNLVNELMDFRTIENGKLPLQVELTDVNDEVRRIFADFRNHAQQHGIRFDIRLDTDLPKELYVDRGIFEKILMNLLHNAFKYTKDGGCISVETYMQAGAFVPAHPHSFTVKGETGWENCFAIVVRDTGIGISQESISSVFERFYKVNTVNFDKHLGTGIGLALVRSLVLLHRGAISIHSEPEQGTDMVVCLPLDGQVYTEDERIDVKEAVAPDDRIVQEEPKVTFENESLLEEPNPPIPNERKRLLLAEDNDDLRHMIADFLSTKFEVIEAENGKAASSYLAEHNVDLIISDIMMPEKDGITFCQEVKTDVSTSHIPFVLLTAKTSLESKLEGASSEADLYFEKPVDFNLLLLSIQNIFKRQEQLKEYYARNYFADASELSTNQEDARFMKEFIEILERNLEQTDMDVNSIAAELSMSRSKLYAKIKSISGKSIVEFILGYKLRKAARLLVKENLTIRESMDQIGIESQSYFTRAFKKEFGETPTAFVAKYRKQGE